LDEAQILKISQMPIILKNGKKYRLLFNIFGRMDLNCRFKPLFPDFKAIKL